MPSSPWYKDELEVLEDLGFVPKKPRREMLYADIYECYLRDTIAATLFKYDFQLLLWPDDSRFYPEDSFWFEKEQIQIGISVSPDVIMGVVIAHPATGRSVSLDAILKKRGVGKVGECSATRFIETERIAEALIDYCQDILGGEVPPELVPSKAKKYTKRNKELTHFELYNYYLKDTVGQLLLEHGFEMVSPPTNDEYAFEVTFIRDSVGVILVLTPGQIYDTWITGPVGDADRESICPLQLLLRKRHCDSAPIDLAPTRTAMARAITNALQDYCPDVLAGNVPAQLLEDSDEWTRLERVRDEGGTSTWVPPTTPSPRPRRNRLSLSMLTKTDAGSVARPEKKVRGNRGRSKPAGE